METQFPDYNKISPTAKMVAYWRQFSDVPFATEVAELIQAKETSDNLLHGAFTSTETMAWLAPMIEARYKSLVSAIKKQGIKQVLELASGVSLRGLAMTTDPEMIYVETDLAGISEEKKQLVQKIKAKQKISDRTNLFFHTANVLNLEELEKAAVHFSKDRPIAIIHEGLMPYLSMKEKEIAARNIHVLLSRFGGVWITPDFATKAELEKNWRQNDEMKKMTDAVHAATERDFKEAAFDSEQQITDFFSNLGFEIAVAKQIDGSYELTAVDRLHVPQSVVTDYADDLKIWTLKVRA